MALTATWYAKPNGEQRDFIIKDINPDDKSWFLAHDVRLSAEEGALSQEVILYAQVGEEDGDPIEALIITNVSTESCKDALSRLRQEAEELCRNVVTV